MTDAYSLLIEGNLLEMTKVVLDSSLFGVYTWVLLVSMIIIVSYIKSESLEITGFISFVCLATASVVWNLQVVPILFAVLGVFITLLIFDLFIKKKGGGF